MFTKFGVVTQSSCCLFPLQQNVHFNLQEAKFTLQRTTKARRGRKGIAQLFR